MLFAKRPLDEFWARLRSVVGTVIDRASEPGWNAARAGPAPAAEPGGAMMPDQRASLAERLKDEFPPMDVVRREELGFEAAQLAGEWFVVLEPEGSDLDGVLIAHDAGGEVVGGCLLPGGELIDATALIIEIKMHTRAWLVGWDPTPWEEHVRGAIKRRVVVPHGLRDEIAAHAPAFDWNVELGCLRQPRTWTGPNVTVESELLEGGRTNATVRFRGLLEPDDPADAVAADVAGVIRTALGGRVRVHVTDDETGAAGRSKWIP